MLKQTIRARRSVATFVVAALWLSSSSILAGCENSNTSRRLETAAPAPVTASPVATSPAPSAATTTARTGPSKRDGRLEAGSFFHDSRHPFYRSPGGAVEAGTNVVLRLKTAPDDPASASVRLWNSTSSREVVVPMAQVDSETLEVTIPMPKGGAALWYRFVLQDGMMTGYYYDDPDRDGGTGEGRLSLVDHDYVIVAYDPGFQTPAWVRDGVVYQIFPDRFRNGDAANDKPAGSFFYGGETVARQWGEKPTGGNDFFGGDLQGVVEKLDYLQSLGVTAIYLNPIFQSPSNHRYDTTDYLQIEPSLGTLETFKKLVAQAKARGIRIILDGVFNHSSSDSLYFDKFGRYDTQGASEVRSSPYFDWYAFKDWPENYESWSGIDTLPVYRENQEVKRFLFTGPESVVKRWMTEDLGGWRLDAAEQKSHAFWREFRKVVKEQDPEAVIVGEFWHNSAPWLAGDQWDGTMNYRFKDATLGWLGNKVRPVEAMVKELDSIREDYPEQALAASMNLIGTHDTARALTEVSGDKNMLRLLALMQFTWPGMPTIYYGDEAGMEGRRDPDDRRTYPWGSEDQTLIDFYRTLARIRHTVSALRTGEYTNLGYDNKQDYYAFARKDDRGLAVVALNRSASDLEVDLPIAHLAPDGNVLRDELNAGTAYMAADGKLRIKIPARWGALLVGQP